MVISSDLAPHLEALAAAGVLDVEPDELLAAMRGCGDDVVDLLTHVAALRNTFERVFTVGTAVVTERSMSEQGHPGLAATRGHRSPLSLVQSISGGTKTDAARAVRLAQTLLDGADNAGADAAHPPANDDSAGGESGSVPIVEVPWHDPLRRAMLDGRLTSAQHDAIFRGLGQPPERDGIDAVAMGEVWRIAGARLLEEASELSVEDLLARARQARDILDPIGAEDRFSLRFEKRSFRLYTDSEGQRRASIAFDDEMGAWAQAIVDAGLRPRRNGPRFMTDHERAQAAVLAADPRTNDQLSYDLMMDVLRAGAIADAREVFGTRQPGVRMVVVKDVIGPRDAIGRLLAVGHLEDRGDAMPGSVIDRALCTTGAVEVTVDSCGNPLDVGREQRLFTTAQRIALVVRDGGCIWPECSTPASYCEAHHCDHWSEGGRTDTDHGVLLCRYHHLLLHNQGWRIRRDGGGAFVLFPPGDAAPAVLASKAAWKWAWDPPPAPDRARWRAA